MALRDQPYLPLYVQDFLTDEKLIECSAAATGVYIRIMCILHKSEAYGQMFLKAKHKQNESNLANFAVMLQRHLPYSQAVIYEALVELTDEGVLSIEGDCLYQKRMKRDGDLSAVRATAGGKGGKSGRKRQKQNESKTKANAENENEYENENTDKKKKGGAGERKNTTPDSLDAEQFEAFRRRYPGTKRGHATELLTLKKHRDWHDVLPKLLPALEAEMRWRETANAAGTFCPPWPHLQTWLRQRRWETETPQQADSANTFDSSIPR